MMKLTQWRQLELYEPEKAIEIAKMEERNEPQASSTEPTEGLAESVGLEAPETAEAQECKHRDDSAGGTMGVQEPA